MSRIRGLHGAWIALLAAAADRVSKAAVVRMAHRGVLIPGIINLRPVENHGAAFSMLWGQDVALILLTVALIAGLLAWLIARPEAPRGLRAGLWLIVGGGLGNLYDRLFFGGVADFIELAFVRFAVFNIADVCICVGAALAVVAMALDERKGKRAR